MPTHKDFKRVVRTRMQKTGESYTAARASLLHTTKPAAPAAPPDYAALAGMSDAALKTKTGCAWDRWVYALDKVGAHAWPHREIAEYVHAKYKVPGWWSQTVTVGYERIKGLRAKGQRRDGGFEANKSRTYAVPVSRLYRAWRDGRTRRRWLPEGVSIRTAVTNRSMRIGWRDGTTVALWFTAKGRTKSAVAVGHLRLPDRAAADGARAFWGAKLDALGAVLTG